MQRVLSRAQMRELDRLATAKLGVPSVVLMENAGRGAADIIARALDLSRRMQKPPRVTIVCGAGNNGGDGYVVARRLALLGACVEVWSAVPVEHLRGDAAVNRHACEQSLGKARLLDANSLDAFSDALANSDAAVDALFGTGLERPIEGLVRQIIERLNAASVRRFALDLPSGIDANTGHEHGIAVRADVTITFAEHKLGLLTASGAAHAGHIELVDIGVDPNTLTECGHSAHLASDAALAAILKPRGALAHKGSSGRVLVLAGSPGKVGAALLVAEGALRAGAGLVTLAGVPAVADALDRRVLEAMSARIDPDNIQTSLAPLLEATHSVAIGPGIGFDATARAIVEHVVLRHPGPVVVDADAITHFKATPESLRDCAGPRILTPHSGELGRLLSSDARDVETDRFTALARAVELTHCIVLLKGPHTLVGAPNQTPIIGARGSAALATGGSGDVLGGVIAALTCELEPFQAAWAAAYLHARVAELWSTQTHSDRGLVAHEIAAAIPNARADILARAPVPASS
ncbi:MAG: NAD(P)H-hydrate dehydratase [Myxococcota bacterium]